MNPLETLSRRKSPIGEKMQKVEPFGEMCYVHFVVSLNFYVVKDQLNQVNEVINKTTSVSDVLRDKKTFKLLN